MKTDKQLRREVVNTWKKRLKLTVDDILGGKLPPSSKNCAFCKHYMGLDCADCPVSKETGSQCCRGTPYVKAATLYLEIYSGKHHRLAQFHKAVQKEIDFLEALEV